VEKYREIRRAALGPEDADNTAEARLSLQDAAASVARELGRQQKELTYIRSFVIGAVPAAIGYLGGAGIDALIGAPPGVTVGGLAAVMAPEMLKPVTERLWGWVIGRLPFVNARKLLSRSVQAEAAVGANLTVIAEHIWHRGYT
jgi:hypothetical protein